MRVGDFVLSMDLRTWVNSGLMSFFFLVVGLEAEGRSTLASSGNGPGPCSPVLAGIGGMTAAIGFYLAINAGRPSAQGWGVAMSTDTALALGLLALLGHRVPGRLRAFVLTVTVVDDIVGVVVIATAYMQERGRRPAPRRCRFFRCRTGGGEVARRLRLGVLGPGVAAWVAMSKSGVDPVVVGLGAGLVAYAAPVARPDLERASSLFVEFREQPTPELARSARRPAIGAIPQCQVGTAVPPVDQLPDRAALRPCQRRNPGRRQPPFPRLHLTGNPGHFRWLCRREAFWGHVHLRPRPQVDSGGGCARRWDGRRSSAEGRWPGLGSPSRC